MELLFFSNKNKSKTSVLLERKTYQDKINIAQQINTYSFFNVCNL